jgi:flagellar motor switch/type III secretory pathway protein FliN
MDNRSNLSRFAKVPFDIQAQLERIIMRISEILNLNVGTVIGN